MEYVDPSAPVFNSQKSATFRGTTTLDGMPAVFSANYHDMGESGPSNDDYISVQIDAFEWPIDKHLGFDGIIDGGNIQLHKK
ncbi:hypothetical protein ACFLTV_02390 [Chloroflexota bacterium]